VRDGAGEVTVFEEGQAEKYRGAEVDRRVDPFEAGGSEGQVLQ